MRRPRVTRRALLLAASALIGLAGVAVLLLGARGTDAPVRPEDDAHVASGRTAALPSAPPPAAAAPSSVPPARYTPSSSVHLRIPAVGLDLPLLGMSPRGGAVDPPLLTAGYWIEPYGAPVATAEEAVNTLYVAAHSAGRGSDGFDPLLGEGGSSLSAGDVVEVDTGEGTVRYTVRSTRRYAKDELPGAQEVWEASPGRLVLITCFQRADGREATENVVVVAES